MVRKVTLRNVGRRKERGKFYTVYLCAPKDLPEIRKILKEKYKTVIARRVGKPTGKHYALWCRGAKH